VEVYAHLFAQADCAEAAKAAFDASHATMIGGLGIVK
jgi:hypothetical protein